MTKERVWEQLRQTEGFVSGEEIAGKLSLSRAAVWKAIEQLREEGYRIESAQKRGYRLLPSDVLSEEGVRRFLKTKEIKPKVYRSIGSTNTVLKSLAANGEPTGTALIAGEQTEGRGRMGRSFYSPKDSGLYLSLLLRPQLEAAQATRITACAAVAAAETIEELSGRRTQIKWVNDIFLDDRKVCGILTEASVDCESGMMHYVVVGIGINTRVPEGDYPEELRGIAGAAFGGQTPDSLRCRLAAGVLDRLWGYCAALPEEDCFAAYRDRSLVLGKAVELLLPGREPERAVVLELGRDYSLLVRLADGSMRRVQSGEVRVRPAE